MIFATFIANIFKIILVSLENVIYVCALNIKNMNSIGVLNSQIQEAKERRKQLVLEAMDGRTQKSISDKTGIDEPRLSKWINGLGELENTELEKLAHVLGLDL